MKLAASMKAGALELVTRPHVFVRRPEFRIILGVYFSTYAVANATTTGEILDANMWCSAVFVQ